MAWLQSGPVDDYINDYTLYRQFTWSYRYQLFVHEWLSRPIVGSPFLALSRLTLKAMAWPPDEADNSDLTVLPFFNGLFPSLRELTITSERLVHIYNADLAAMRRSVTRSVSSPLRD